MRHFVLATLGICVASACAPAATVYTEILPNAGLHNRFYNEFTNIAPISSDDLAQGITPVAVSGGAAFATTNAGLTNGPDQVNGGSDGGIVTGGGFATEGVYLSRMRLDLGVVRSITQINLYTWHSGGRLDQVVDIYGAVGNEAGLSLAPNASTQTPPAHNGDTRPNTDATDTPDDHGWTYIATVDTRIPTGVPANPYNNHSNAQIGSKVIGVGGYRYLLLDIWGVDVDNARSGYFGEIDVLPEPMALGAIGCLLPLALRRRR